MPSESPSDSGQGGRSVPGIFATTHWSVVLTARDGDVPSGSAAEALEQLCRVYWPPIYAFIRRRGHSPHDAEDLTQGFFAVFLEKNNLVRVGPEKGRFRAFLLASVKNFLSNHRQRGNRLKRGGQFAFISWEEIEAEAGPPAGGDPSTAAAAAAAFDRQWATAVVRNVTERLRRQCEEAGKADLFAVLQPYLTGRAEKTHADAGLRLGMSAEAVQVAVSRLRRRFGELLRAEISWTVGDSADVDDELRHLFAALGEGEL